MNESSGACQCFHAIHAAMHCATEHEKGFVPSVMVRARAGTTRPCYPEKLIPTRLFYGRQHRDLETADVQRSPSLLRTLNQCLFHVSLHLGWLWLHAIANATQECISTEKIHHVWRTGASSEFILLVCFVGPLGSTPPGFRCVYPVWREQIANVYFGNVSLVDGGVYVRQSSRSTAGRDTLLTVNFSICAPQTSR